MRGLTVGDDGLRGYVLGRGGREWGGGGEGGGEAGFVGRERLGNTRVQLAGGTYNKVERVKQGRQSLRTLLLVVMETVKHERNAGRASTLTGLRVTLQQSHDGGVVHGALYELFQ